MVLNVKRIKGAILAEVSDITNRFSVMSEVYLKGIVIATNLYTDKAQKFLDDEYLSVWLSLNNNPACVIDE